jgi:acetyl-CoA synthetase
MSIEISSESFENLSYEDRTFTPSQSFIDNSNTKNDIYDEANKDRLAFWGLNIFYINGMLTLKIVV